MDAPQEIVRGPTYDGVGKPAPPGRTTRRRERSTASHEHRHQAGRACAARRHPLRGRLGRRHAAHRRPLHRGDRGLGNDLATLPNFPAEIRAPQGTLPGVSSFQLHFADHEVLTPGDAPDVLVAMNPAALKANLRDLPRGAVIVLNTDEFTKRNLTKVGYATDPRDDGSLDSYLVHALPLTSMTVKALEGFALTRKEAERSTNMFALGLLSWLYTRPTEPTRRFLEGKFGRTPELLAANLKAFEAGWSFGETTEAFAVHYEVAPAPAPSGVYRNVTGNIALAYGLVAAAHQAERPLVLGSYPITPASDILHTLSRLKRFGVTTLQAEDEIAAIGMALGASLRRRDRRHGDVRARPRAEERDHRPRGEPGAAADRGRRPARRPRTGLPTKTEQADLLQAMFGRNGESPVPIVAPALARRLLRRRARGRPDRDDLPHARAAALRRVPGQRLRALAGPRRRGPARPAGRVRGTARRRRRPVFRPYDRDPLTLARPWAPPGAPGLEHRIGGIEKADGTGEISYDPDNHDHMVRLRQAKVDGIDVAPLEVDDPAGDAEILVVGWGSTYGPSRRPRASCARAGSRSRPRTCAASTRSRRTPARSCAATARCSSPR